MATRVDSIALIPTVRFVSGDDELDWQFGRDEPDARHPNPSYGIPCNALSLWAGGQGVGKTRTMVSICRRLLDRGETVLFFTLENNASKFRSAYCKDIPSSANFFISEAKDLATQISEIRLYKPLLVVIDSVNRIQEYRKWGGCDLIEDAYRAVAADLNNHIAFIPRLNIDGKVKGGTDLLHMVDTVLYLTKYVGSQFHISVIEKNRFGKTGTQTWWQHDASGVKCTSDARYDDAEWRGVFGMTIAQRDALRVPGMERINRILIKEGVIPDPCHIPKTDWGGFFRDLFIPKYRQ